MTLTISELMEKIPGTLARQAAPIPDAVAQFRFSGSESGDWIVEFKNGAASVAQGTHPAPQVTVSMDADDCIKLVSGALDPMQAFLQGKIRVSGDMTLAMKLAQLLRG